MYVSPFPSCLRSSPFSVSGGLPPVPWHGMYVLRHGMYVPPPGTWVPRPGSRRRPRRVFFFCPLCAVCQPFAFPWKNILKKNEKKFGPYGEVVVPLHPISGKKIPRSREIFGSFTWNNDRSTGRARPSLASFFGARGEEAFAPWT